MTTRDWLDLIKLHATRQEGQTMSEYSVVLGIIVIGVIAAVGFLALAIAGKLDVVTEKINGLISGVTGG
jgi:Flp pilus assembly pilin Flp